MDVSKENLFCAAQVIQLLPHKYPFVFVDGVNSVDLEQGAIICEKLVSINEPSLQGHFPGNPIFPGVLIIEALAQASGILAGCLRHSQLSGNHEFESLLSTFRNTKLFLVESTIRNHRQILPGAVIMLKSKVSRQMEHFFKFEVEASVDDEIVARGQLMLASDE